MINKSKLNSAVLNVSLLAFIVFVVYILYINFEVLYTAHDRSEFLFGTPFFYTLISKPFGLMQYLGAWLTQLCYRPSLGASVMMIIWTLIFYVGTKAFRLQGSASALMLLPVACLLTSVVDLGYWIYISIIRGYWFSQSIGYFVMLLLLWATRCTPRNWHLFWYLLAFCLYPVLGWFAMLFVLCLVVTEKPTWRELLGIVILVFTASIWHTQYYSYLKFDDVVLAGLPRFVTPNDKTDSLTIPFLVLGAVSVLIPLCSKYLNKVVVSVLCVAVCIIFTLSFMFYDRNYIDEMRMVRYASDDNWNEVLSIAADNPKPTTTIVMLKNVALMNEGGLLDCSFKMGNISYPISNPDSIHVSFLDIASPLVYYNYGLINEGIRLNYEKAIQVGFSPFYMKTLSRCNLAKGDKALVERYSSLLHHQLFYDNWMPTPVTENVMSLQNCYSDELTGVENSDSYIVNSISLWHETDSKVASEQTLFYAMLRCDSHRFWPSLRNYLKLHVGEDFPLHAQEAYIFFIDRFPEEKRMMIPVEEGIYNRYRQFCKALTVHVKPGKTLGEAAEVMRDEWGDTYWYYNIFGRQYSNIVERKGNEVYS